MKDLYKDMLSIIIGILLVQLLWSSFNNDFMIIKEKIYGKSSSYTKLYYVKSGFSKSEMEKLQTAGWTRRGKIDGDDYFTKSLDNNQVKKDAIYNSFWKNKGLYTKNIQELLNK